MNIAAPPAAELQKSGKGSEPEGILWNAGIAGTGTWKRFYPFPTR